LELRGFRRISVMIY